MMTAPDFQDKGVRATAGNGAGNTGGGNVKVRGSLQDIKTPAVFGGW
jgi:hypothetical protein